MTTLITSPAPKARATAHILSARVGVPVVEDVRLREVEMSTGFLPAVEFHARVTAYLGGYADPDLEPATAALRRARSVLSDHAGPLVSLVSHGRLLALLYSALVSRTNPVEVWEAMGFPDWAFIDLESGTALKRFGQAPASPTSGRSERLPDASVPPEKTCKVTLRGDGHQFA